MKVSSLNCNEHLALVIEKVKAALAGRGAKTIRGMGRSFRIMDSVDGNRKLDKQEFYWGIKDMGVNISKREAEILIDALDTDQDGTVNYDEFLTGLRGKPNEQRQAMIDKAFLKFDMQCKGVITPNDLSKVFNTSNHPKVRTGEMSHDQVFA